jgi:hypothetical protein
MAADAWSPGTARDARVAALAAVTAALPRLMVRGSLPGTRPIMEAQARAQIPSLDLDRPTSQ